MESESNQSSPAVDPYRKFQRIFSKQISPLNSQLSRPGSFFEQLCSFMQKSISPMKRASAAASAIDYASVVQASVKRANTERLREIFERYASVQSPKTGAPEMSPEDFVRRYLGMFPEENFNKESVRLIASAADTTRDGMISFEEFQAFESILCSPDALYLTAFEMFDTNASDTITFDEFQRIIRHTQPVIDMSFDFDSEFIKLYFGEKRNRSIGYLEFCQLLHDFYEEQGVQAFKNYDRRKIGYITAVDFHKIMTTVKNHMLTSVVRVNLIAAAGGGGSHLVSFPYYMAFNSLLSKLELFKRIYIAMAKGNLKLPITKEEFLHAAQPYAHVTPLEVDILFRLTELMHPGQGWISFEDLERVDPEHLKRVSYIRRITNVKAVKDASERGALMASLESAYRFTLGSIAGACGATAVYPIDLVKTRMQNQRSGSYVGELMYKSSWDCFRKVVRHEGVAGLYRGLIPQWVGVAPEKAIKLTMNDFLRDKLAFNGQLPLWGEIVSGGCAGASQVVFTNPLEIVKIRLQVAGEIQVGPKISVFTVLRDLGFRGLYKGAKACFLRDIPFSAIYFPVYAHMKTLTSDENGHNRPSSLFFSAMVAGVPAAGLVTPADVIKTRLQVAARAGQTTYSGVIDCYRKVMHEEGWKAFWKGAGARVCRSSPQFGVTLLVYELLQRIFYVDFGGTRPAGSEVPAHRTLADEASENPDHIGGYKLARATFAGIEAKFGLFLPRFEINK